MEVMTKLKNLIKQIEKKHKTSFQFVGSYVIFGVEKEIIDNEQGLAIFKALAFRNMLAAKRRGKRIKKLMGELE